jgi:hypothetical protein
MSSEDPAQNRGGSRNFTETTIPGRRYNFCLAEVIDLQYIFSCIIFLLVLQEYTFGPGHQSGNINTFAVMKSGIKNVDSTGRTGPIPSHKAQKCLVCSS